MSDPVLTVESLSKCYPLGQPKAQEETLLSQGVTTGMQLLRRLKGLAPAAEAKKEALWALRDLSFSVAEGEVVSIIGHNGSGKSTLLKILSRITAPTEGHVRVRGRLASLLEVGTGFHPDLSGRDNIYLNAAILGLRREEIRRRFDAIVDFSGVETYIDAPVKTYSSGMKVRLGFAVAAHIDPDVLIIDEVLAVGDAAFQQRCLNRIEEVGASGRTILYVSHHLPSVARLSRRCLLLDHGRLLCDGPTLSTIRHYEEKVGIFRSSMQWDDPARAPGDDCTRLLSVKITHNGEPVTGPIDVRHTLEISLRYEVFKSGLMILPSLHLHDMSGTPVISSIDNHPEWHGKPRPAGVYETSATFPGNLFNEGSFQLGLALSTLSPFQNHAYVHAALAFSFYDPITGDSTRGQYHGELKGYLRPALAWETTRVRA